MVAHALTLTSNDAESWLASLEEAYSEAQRELLRQALAWLADHAADAVVDTGTDLAEHSLGTAAILAGMRFDAETVAAALLCGLPDAALTRDKLTKAFGAHLAALVEGAAKLTRMEGENGFQSIHGAGDSQKIRAAVCGERDQTGRERDG